MSLIFNEVDVEHIRFNGVLLDHAYMNGILVYTRLEPGEEVFDTPGAHQFTVPERCTEIMVHRIGGGGAGGGAEMYYGPAIECQGGGGFRGNEITGVMTVTPGQVINLSVGTGGVGKEQNSDGAHEGQGGTASIFADLVYAFGGAGGQGHKYEPVAGYIDNGAMIYPDPPELSNFTGFNGEDSSVGAGGEGYASDVSGDATAGIHGAGGGGSAVVRTKVSWTGNGGDGYIKVSWGY